MNFCIVCVWEFENYITARSNCTYEQIIWRQYSEIENSVTETRFSDINRTMLLKCVFLTAYQLNCFYRAMRADCFFERSHFLITLTSSLYYLFLQIPAEEQNCRSSTWGIFKSQIVILFVSFNFYIFLLLIIKTNHYLLQAYVKNSKAQSKSKF